MFLKAVAMVGVATTASLLATATPAAAGTDSQNTSLAVVSVGVLDMQWAGGNCMDVPVILTVTSSPYTTSWSTELSSEGYSVYFSGSGRVSSTKQYLKICKSGGLVPGTHHLSGEVSVRSTNPMTSVNVHVSAPFTISKATTDATIYSIQRTNDRVTIFGRVSTAKGLPPGGLVSVQAKKPGRSQPWRTISTRNVSSRTDVSASSRGLPKRTKYRLVYGGDTLADPDTSPIKIR